jgi:hypothetical protein
MKISIKDKVIPRNKDGDPAFTRLEVDNSEVSDPPTLMNVFTDGEIVELVNRALYQLEYQARSHADRRQKQLELERPVKAVFKMLYPHDSYAKATPIQIKACLEKLTGKPIR